MEGQRKTAGGGARPKGKKGRGCSKCGEEGHNERTCADCGIAPGEDEAWLADQAAKKRKVLEGRVKRMVDGKLSTVEIKAALKGDNLTEREVEELIAWAQHK